MDLLYRAYSNPLDLMNMYINRGRFGNFVEGFLQAEFERRKAENEKYNDLLMWIAYVHSYSTDNFNDWKKRHCGTDSTTKKKNDADLTEEGISKIISNVFQG